MSANRNDEAISGEPKDSTPVKETSETPSRLTWRLPSWLNHFNRHHLKILLRCWAGAWVATVLMLIHPVLQDVGFVSWFAILTVLVVPPAGVLLAYLIGVLTLLFGMCAAWAWGLVTMKAALAARPSSETEALYQGLKQQAAMMAQKSGLPTALETQALIHNGYMLDARVTVVFFVMGGLFVYAMARLRCSNPKFVFAQVFGTVIMDLFILYGPQQPAFNSLLPVIIIKPAAIGSGLGALSCLLVFPQSSSHLVMGKLQALLAAMEGPMEVTRKRMSGQRIEPRQVKSVRDGLLGTFKSVETLLSFLPLDFCRCQWGPEDLQGLTDHIQKAMFASASLLDFHISNLTVINHTEHLQSRRAEMEAGSSSYDYDDHRNASSQAFKSTDKNKNLRLIGKRQVLDSKRLIEAIQGYEKSNLKQATLVALKEAGTDLINQYSQAIKLLCKTVHIVTSNRYIGSPSESSMDNLAYELRETLNNLRAARETYGPDVTERILQVHADLFDQAGNLIMDNGACLPVRSVVLSMVLEERLIEAVKTLEDALEHVTELVQTRRKNRFWMPTMRLRHVFSWITDGRLSFPMVSQTHRTDDDPDSATEPLACQDGQAEPYARVRYGRNDSRRRSSRYLIAAYKWLVNHDGMYALRMVTVTMAMSIPSVLPHTAGFFYREKGLWALIAAQTCLVPYLADFVFSLLSRGAGTLLGCLLAMLAWYVGSGSGDGNPYGIAAATAFTTAIVVWLRIWLPPQYGQATLLVAIAYPVVLGFSWDDHHIAIYGAPGVGYVAFYKRLATVLLGYVAATAVQIFPKPPSASEHVRKTLSNTVSTISDLYAMMLSSWGEEINDEQKRRLGDMARRSTLDILGALSSLDATMGVLNMELSFVSLDRKTLAEIQDKCRLLTRALSHLVLLPSSMHRDFQSRFVKVSGMLDHRTMGDVMAVLAIVEQSLRTGRALPERLPTPLISRFYETWVAQRSLHSLRVDLMRNEDYRKHAVSVMEYTDMLVIVDEIVLVLKRALGESYLVCEWQQNV